ncbi:MAG: hypothetical protein KDK70_12785, partial [Myxococcales bacterium]|nr:hypothetical protein [Myxococcales bacterium]
GIMAPMVRHGGGTIAGLLVVVGCAEAPTMVYQDGTAEGSTSSGSISSGSIGEPMSTSTTGAGQTGGAGSTNPTLDGSTSSDTTGSASGSEAEGSTGALGCDRALWVTGDTAVEANGDTPFHARLLALGFSTTVVQNAASQTEDAEGHCLVVLSPLGAASDVQDKFRDVAVPLITWEYNLYDDLRMVDPLGSGWGIDESLDQLEIVLPAHPLAAGLQGAVSVFSGGGRISWGIPVGEVQIVATALGDPSRATIFAFDAGAMMADGFVAPARRVALGGGETPIPVTMEAVELFEAAVRWSVE